MNRGFLPVSINNAKNSVDVLLPLRATKTSAGYDFYTPVDLVIAPQTKLLVWTDLKAKMPVGEVLLLDVRSSMGIKNDLMLANTLGVIDQDYFDNKDNEGNIGICLRNLKPEMKLVGHETVEVMQYGEIKIINVPIIEDLREVNTVRIKAGDRVAQGIFVKFEEAENCNSDADRTGGIGSTSK